MLIIDAASDIFLNIWSFELVFLNDKLKDAVLNSGRISRIAIYIYALKILQSLFGKSA